MNDVEITILRYVWDLKCQNLLLGLGFLSSHAEFWPPSECESNNGDYEL